MEIRLLVECLGDCACKTSATEDSSFISTELFLELFKLSFSHVKSCGVLIHIFNDIFESVEVFSDGRVFLQDQVNSVNNTAGLSQGVQSRIKVEVLVSILEEFLFGEVKSMELVDNIDHNKRSSFEKIKHFLENWKHIGNSQFSFSTSCGGIITFLFGVFANSVCDQWGHIFLFKL